MKNKNKILKYFKILEINKIIKNYKMIKMRLKNVKIIYKKNRIF
jgi:hypothetical protein